MKLDKNTTVVVTGVTRGIGKAILKNLELLGVKVIAISRGIKTHREGRVQYISVDLSEASAVEKALIYISKSTEKIDVLINNAGVVYSSEVVKSKMSKVREIMEINFFTPINFMVQLSPLIQKEGVIVNVLSPVIYRTSAGISFYSSSKAALRHSSLALRRELREKNAKIRVIDYYPGLVRTNIFNSEIKTTSFVKMLRVTPEYTAKNIISSIRNNKNGNVYEPVARLIQLAGLFGL